MNKSLMPDYIKLAFKLLFITWSWNSSQDLRYRYTFQGIQYMKTICEPTNSGEQYSVLL
jgi:hypothetical protein